MRDIFGKFVWFIYRVFFALADIVANLQFSSMATMGDRSRFTRQASVFNLQKNKANVKVGSDSIVRGQILIFPYGGKITIGEWCYIAEDTRIWSGDSIAIGNHVAIAHNTNIVDCAHEVDYLERAEGIRNIMTSGHPVEKGNVPTAPIVIEDYVAIYPNSNILRGVTIGRGAVIGAGSVVLGDVPPFALMQGNPARRMMSLDK